jgi:hypothetical protein
VARCAGRGNRQDNCNVGALCNIHDAILKYNNFDNFFIFITISKNTAYMDMDMELANFYYKDP